MGVHKNISYNKFPKQSEHLGKPVDVCFEYNSKYMIPGKVIRDDIEDPYTTLIQLKDGRVVNATECQYSFKK